MVTALGSVNIYNFTGFLPNANLYSKENLTSFIRDQIKVLDDFA